MSETKEFHLGDILSITTGCLVSKRHIDGVYDILNWMTGESLYTHQLPRVIREAGPVLLAYHPHLSAIEIAELAPEAVEGWLAEQVAKFGETLPVPKLNEEQHERIDPFSELAEVIHPDRIIVIGQ